MFASLVIPAYNERENLGELTVRLKEILKEIGIDYEIIYVIQGNDGSKELIDNLNDKDISYIYYEKPIGVSKAFIEGFKKVNDKAEIVVTMDADLNHQPEEFPSLLNKLRETNADIIIGSRYIKGGKMINMPLWKNILSRAMNKIINIFSGTSVQDKTSGYRIYKKAVIKKIIGEIKAQNFEFYPEVIILAHKAKFTFAETPITFIFRVHGKSKMKKIDTMFRYVKMFWRKIWEQ